MLFNFLVISVDRIIKVLLVADDPKSFLIIRGLSSDFLDMIILLDLL